MHLRHGMVVRSVDNRQVGRISALNDCCLQLDLRDRSAKANVVPDAVLQVDENEVVLACTAAELRRYECPGH